AGRGERVEGGPAPPAGPFLVHPPTRRRLRHAAGAPPRPAPARRRRTPGLGRPGLPGLFSGRARAGASPMLARRGVLPVVPAILAGRYERLLDDRQVVVG